MKIKLPADNDPIWIPLGMLGIPAIGLWLLLLVVWIVPAPTGLP